MSGMKKYLYQDDFFEMPNIVNSYYAGFIAADGCISRDKRSQHLALSIKIQGRDKSILYNLKNDIKFDGPIKHVKRSKSHHKDYVRIRLTLNNKIFNDLKNNFNITPNKSLTLKPPTQLNKECSIAFIIGLIDGDGSIHYHPTSKIRLKISGTYEVLFWIKSIFDVLEPKYKRSLAKIQHRKITTSCDYCVAGVRAIKLLNILNKINVPKLNRKWNKLCKQ